MSVVVAVYNVDKYLAACVESLLCQTYSNIEIILVDDGSTDTSGALCDKYARVDKRIRVIHQKNLGLSGARNAGLRVSNAKYIMFVDGDDWTEANMVEGLISRAERVEADVVMCGYHVDFLDGDGHVISSVARHPVPQMIEPSFAPAKVSEDLIGFVGYAWNKLYLREHLIKEQHSFVEGLSLVEDIIFNSQVLSGGSRIVVAEDAYLHYVQRQRYTLGSQFYPDHLPLLLLRLDAVESLLSSWAVDEREVHAIRRSLGASGLRTCLKSLVEHRSMSFFEKTRHLREMVREPAAKKFLIEISNSDNMTLTDRAVQGLLRHNRAETVILASALRSRWR